MDAEKNQTLPVLRGNIIVRGRLVHANVLEGPYNSDLLDISHGSSSTSESKMRSPRWKPDLDGVNIAATKCLLVAVSKHYVYALALLPMESEHEQYTRVGMVNWRVDPSEFGWDGEQGAHGGWKDSSGLEAIKIF
jgi:hypothetical protein